MPTKVLVVEDNLSLQLMIRDGLRRLQDIEELFAETIPDARRILAEHPDIAIIAIDGCVPGIELNTLPLIREIVESGFKGELIAISGDDRFREEMRLAGCGRECRKQDLPFVVGKFLARTFSPPLA